MALFIYIAVKYDFSVLLLDNPQKCHAASFSDPNQRIIKSFSNTPENDRLIHELILTTTEIIDFMPLWQNCPMTK